MHREYDRSRALAAPYSKAINAQRDVTKHSLSITQSQTTLRGDREKDREHIVAKFDGDQLGHNIPANTSHPGPSSELTCRRVGLVLHLIVSYLSLSVQCEVASLS